MTTESILLQLFMYFTLDIWKAKLLVNKIKCRNKFFTMDKYLLIFTPLRFFGGGAGPVISVRTVKIL